VADDPEQLSLPIDPATGPAPASVARPEARRAKASRAPQLELSLREPRVVAVIDGGGSGSGHRRARLVALDGGAAAGKGATPQRPLPTRDEITGALLGGLADLVAGRISAAAASAIREAAEDALRQLEASERDPHRVPQFVRAARALQELLPGR
jgi:hypothetical protein